LKEACQACRGGSRENDRDLQILSCGTTKYRKQKLYKDPKRHVAPQGLHIKSNNDTYMRDYIGVKKSIDPTTEMNYVDPMRKQWIEGKIKMSRTTSWKEEDQCGKRTFIEAT
jgi:hypothetical protein